MLANTSDSRSPLVSLIMPVWRPRRHWLIEAVSGALSQRDCAVELIVVDDGSDEPVARLLTPEQHNPRLTVIRTPHLGASNARNAGVEIARGSHMRFIDCDDVIAAGSTAHLLGLMGDDHDVITYGATLVCDQDLRPLARMSTDVQGPAVTACLLNRFNVTIHSLLFHSSVVSATGAWEPSLTVSEDWDFVLRALDHARVRGDSEIATYYRTHATMSSRDLTAGIYGYRRVVERYFERHPEMKGAELERQAEAEWHLYAAEQLLTRRSQYLSSVSHLRRALTVRPWRAVSLGMRLVRALILARLSNLVQRAMRSRT